MSCHLVTILHSVSLTSKFEFMAHFSPLTYTQKKKKTRLAVTENPLKVTASCQSVTCSSLAGKMA